MDRNPCSSTAFWRAITLCGIVVYLAFGLVYLLMGQLNADEGWYLYASHLVYQGKLPYRDFAYTQTPLLPYVYGLVQMLPGSRLYLGRMTSYVLSGVNLALCISIARRLSGSRAAALTTLFCATFVYGIYFTVIVKTYALVSTCFLLTHAILSSRIPDHLKYPLGALLAVLSSVTRLSAAAFAAVIVLHCIIQAPKLARIVILCQCVTIVAVALAWTLPAWEAAQWNLLGHHLGQWGGLDVVARIRHNLTDRIPGLLYWFLPYWLLGTSLVVVSVVSRNTRAVALRYIRGNPQSGVILVGLGLFAAAHLVTGGFHAEYFVPAIIGALPLLSAILVKLHDSTQPKEGPHRWLETWKRPLLEITFLCCLILQPAQHAQAQLDLSGGALPISEVQDLSHHVAQLTEETDEVLALEALWIPVEAHRSTPPGMTMAQFSYQSMETAKAEELGVVNDEILAEYLDHRMPKAVILTELDFRMLRWSPCWYDMEDALSEGYVLTMERELFGQWKASVRVYLRSEE